MGRAHETSSKKEVRIKKDKKIKEKAKKKLEKKENKGSKSFDDMIAYVDEFGNITSTPTDLSQRKKVNAEDIEIVVPKNSTLRTNETTRTGIVTFFNDSKGFGFIKDLTTQESIFVHLNGLTEPVKENNKVSYEVIKTPKGPNAINVKIVREN
jgi:cold shock CspA family protein